MDVAIIGAGMAGLAAARRLTDIQPGLRVTIFDKVSQVGGRALSRQVHNTVVDHGAQYLKTPTPELHRYITETFGHANPVDIGRDVWVFDAHGRITPGDPEENAGHKWSYAEGFSHLAQVMAEGLDVRSSVLVEQIKADASGGYQLVAQNEVIAHARSVLLTPPPPLMLSLLAGSTLPPIHRTAIIQQISRIIYRPCISVALGYKKIPATPPYYALVNPDREHPISWLAYEHLKPGREASGQGIIIAQMAPDWSAAHHIQPHKQLASDVTQLVSSLIGKEFARPDWSDCFCWRYALPKSGCDVSSLETEGLFFAGDYVGGKGRLHLAIESGWAAAERIETWSKQVPA